MVKCREWRNRICDSVGGFVDGVAASGSIQTLISTGYLWIAVPWFVTYVGATSIIQNRIEETAPKFT
jgi:hypothetical protein